MTIGQHEAVSIDPLRIARVVFEVIIPQHFSDVRHTHWRTGMTRIGGLNGIHGERPYGVREIAPGRLASGS